MSRIFFYGYEYVMVLPDGYVPVAILVGCWAGAVLRGVVLRGRSSAGPRQ
jgi:hypothetical protein